MRTPSQLEIAPTIPASTVESVKVLRTAAEIEGIREFWSSCPGVLDSDLDVFLPLNADLPEDLRPCIFVLYRGATPVVLLAARIIRRRITFRIGWLPLFRLFASTLTAPGGGMRGDASPENCKQLVRALLRALKRGEADMAFLWSVNSDSDLFRCVKQEPDFLLRDHFTPLRPHRWRILPGGLDKFYSGLSHRERKRFRQTAKRLDQDFQGSIRIDRFGNEADFDRALEAVEEIAQKTWQRALGRGFNLTDVWRVQSLRTQAERGWLRIHVLSLEGKPCAYSIGALYQRTFYSENIGYDPVHAKYSLGTFLMLRVMEELCLDSTADMFDFGPSDEEYKMRFGNVATREANLRVYAPSARGLALSMVNTMTILVQEPVRMFLKRAGLIQRVKRLWRRLAHGRRAQMVRECE